MDGLTLFQLDILHLVKVGQGKWNWHEIAIRAAGYGDETGELPFPTLKKLESLGLVNHRWIGPSSDRWEITEAGKQLLEQQNDQSE